jgi:hypothetical protein
VLCHDDLEGVVHAGVSVLSEPGRITLTFCSMAIVVPYGCEMRGTPLFRRRWPYPRSTGSRRTSETLPPTNRMTVTTV